MMKGTFLRCFFLLCLVYSSHQNDLCSDIIYSNSDKYPIDAINACAAGTAKSNANCPDLECENSDCLFGFAKDSSGCMTCDCVPDGEEGLFEGDIILTEGTKDFFRRNLDGDVGGRSKRAATRELHIWNQTAIGGNFNVPYYLGKSACPQAKRAINDAIADFNASTCIRLIPHTTERELLSFFEGQGCYSKVGRTPRGTLEYSGTEISLSDGCWNKGTAIHEILHALGLLHEQSRPDRNEFVIINRTNISPADGFNFNKLDDTKVQIVNTPYDIGSVMHYPSNAFAIDSRYPTITDLQGNPIQTQREGLSPSDIEQLHALYNCQAPQPG